MKQKNINPHTVCYLELKDLNESKGIVEFYFAAWTKDLENDTFAPTAFNKTIKENKSRIYHNRDHEDAVGFPLAFGTDENGAWVSSQLAMKTISGADMFEQYKAGLVRGHSNEFQKIKSQGTKGVDRIIEEVKLWGVTSITEIPANLDTPTIELKSYEDFVLQLKKIDDLLTHGKISDELGIKLLSEHKSIYEKLKRFEIKSTEEIKPKGLDFGYIVKNL